LPILVFTKIFALFRVKMFMFCNTTLPAFERLAGLKKQTFLPKFLRFIRVKKIFFKLVFSQMGVNRWHLSILKIAKARKLEFLSFQNLWNFV